MYKIIKYLFSRNILSFEVYFEGWIFLYPFMHTVPVFEYSITSPIWKQWENNHVKHIVNSQQMYCIFKLFFIDLKTYSQCILPGQMFQVDLPIVPHSSLRITSILQNYTTRHNPLYIDVLPQFPWTYSKYIYYTVFSLCI